MKRFITSTAPVSVDAAAGNGEAPARALPSSWYRSPAMYELERRAIFSKKWILVSHKLRFNKPGDFVRFQEAGFAFFLCVDRQGSLNGFHNVCRHRAFPLITKESGNASILACKYHGWSYGINGKLAKAPTFDAVPSFDKSRNNLLPIHTHIDALGFVWVNLEAGEKPSIPWKDDFQGVDTQTRFSKFDTSKYRYDHSWDQVGEYNWKTLADNYNECYHCNVAHPGIKSIVDLDAYYVKTTKGHIQHFSTSKEGLSDQAGGTIASTFLFPNASVTLSPHFFYLMRAVPTSATTTSMEYEVYRHNDATDAEFQDIDELFKQVLKEDKDLCDAAQRNLNAGVFVNGQLHPFNEKGPLYFQKSVKESVMAHRAEEEKLGGGKEICPARQKLAEDSKESEEEIAFCEDLSSCGGGSQKNGKLDW